MIFHSDDNFALQNFEGPLDFLLHLIQKEEIDIYEVSLTTLTQQLISKLELWESRALEAGAESLDTLAYLVWLKSKMLLPSQESPGDEMEMESDPNFEIIHHLLDYCRFKQTAKTLSHRYEEQLNHYPRGLQETIQKKALGLDQLTLQDLSALFANLMAKTPYTLNPIKEELWKVNDKIASIKGLLEAGSSFPITDLLNAAMPRPELVVTFLAVLELMKLGILRINKNEDGELICLQQLSPEPI